ncbi:MAG: helix-turn-helix domain-containing protein [gamma proteobacterium symbiont of Taylorina sp.]|nr:helix-turn-helix domain-containing protein [gamma proteobacterium symbiont of Taylorina sp.]
MKNNIRIFRKKIKIPSRILGDFIGTSPEAVLHYENGRRNPDLKTCRKIVSFFQSHGCGDATLESVFPPTQQSA